MSPFTASTVELIDHMGDDYRAASAARVSFLRDVTTEAASDKDERLLRFLMRNKHTSPFEHSYATFRISAPLPVVAQIMRHRTFSYNQSSRRYTSDDIEFFDVGAWRAQGVRNLQCSDGDLNDHTNQVLTEKYREHCLRSLELYEQMLNMGASREQARLVLPQSLMARFWMSGNLHNYLKFLSLRDSEHAQPECRDVAVQIRSALEGIFPLTMGLYREIDSH